MDEVAIDDRMSAFGRHDLDVGHPKTLEVIRHPFGSALDFMVINGIRRNGRDLQGFDQVLQKTIAVLVGIVERLLQVTHHSS